MTVRWKENDVFSLKLRDGLYTLVQERKNCIVQFFAAFNREDNWAGLDLNEVQPLFFAYVATRGLKALQPRRLASSEVIASKAPVPTRMLTADLSQAPDYSAKLIEMTDNYVSLEATVLTGRLSVPADTATIHAYELCGMMGDPIKLAKRLIRYFETGTNWDDSKAFIFKDIPLPPPDPAWVPGTLVSIDEKRPHTVSARPPELTDNDSSESEPPDLLTQLQPAFEQLTQSLQTLGRRAPKRKRLAAFAEAFDHINRFADDIETGEREAILEKLYDIGTMYGLDRATEYCEQWRGDW